MTNSTSCCYTFYFLLFNIVLSASTHLLSAVAHCTSYCDTLYCIQWHILPYTVTHSTFFCDTFYFLVCKWPVLNWVCLHGSSLSPVFRQGDIGTSWYAVLSGSLDVKVSETANHQVHLNITSYILSICILTKPKGSWFIAQCLQPTCRYHGAKCTHHYTAY